MQQSNELRRSGNGQNSFELTFKSKPSFSNQNSQVIENSPQIIREVREQKLQQNGQSSLEMTFQTRLSNSNPSVNIFNRNPTIDSEKISNQSKTSFHSIKSLKNLKIRRTKSNVSSKIKNPKRAIISKKLKHKFTTTHNNLIKYQKKKEQISKKRLF